MRPMQPRKLAPSVKDGFHVLALNGELDAFDAPALEGAIGREFDRADALVVDLRGAQYLDSTIVRVLLDAHHCARRDDIQLAVVVAEGPSIVLRVLEVSGLLGYLPVSKGLERTLQSMRMARAASTRRNGFQALV